MILGGNSASGLTPFSMPQATSNPTPAMDFPMPDTTDAMLGTNLDFDPSWMESVDNMDWVSYVKRVLLQSYSGKPSRTPAKFGNSVSSTCPSHIAIPPAPIPDLGRHGLRNSHWMIWVCWIRGYGVSHLGKHRDTPHPGSELQMGNVMIFTPSRIE